MQRRKLLEDFPFSPPEAKPFEPLPEFLHVALAVERPDRFQCAVGAGYVDLLPTAVANAEWIEVAEPAGADGLDDAEQVAHPIDGWSTGESHAPTGCLSERLARLRTPRGWVQKDVGFVERDREAITAPFEENVDPRVDDVVVDDDDVGVVLDRFGLDPVRCESGRVGPPLGKLPALVAQPRRALPHAADVRRAHDDGLTPQRACRLHCL